ncbi:MAG TPA: endonuclease/exonuclease/phosphatase family protein, partial [Candidatus Paceibacterota bacterium]
MKIVFLNLLDGELAEPLRTFLQKHKPDTDVFCLQECYTEVQPILSELFEGYSRIGILKPELHNENVFANVMLARNDWDIRDSGSNALTADTGLLQYATLRRDTQVVHIGNVHGLPKPGKLDTPRRTQQSREALELFSSLTGPHIIGGDFNVLPETQSVRMFEAAGYRDLIKDFDIKTTRN